MGSSGGHGPRLSTVVANSLDGLLMKETGARDIDGGRSRLVRRQTHYTQPAADIGPCSSAEGRRHPGDSPDPRGASQLKADRGGESFERAAKGVAVPGAGLGSLEVGGEHVQLAFRPPRLQIHASDQALASEHRKAVIPVAAPARRLVGFYPLLEAEQGLHSRPVPQQRIEGGQQDAAVAARPQAFQLGQAFQILDPDPAGERPSRRAQNRACWMDCQ